MASLNHVFKVIWSVGQNAFVVVPEITTGVCKSQASNVEKSGKSHGLIGFLFKCTSLFTALSIAFSPAVVLAGPTGFNPVSGNTEMSVNGNTTTLNQTSGKAIVNWDSFNIGAGEAVNIIQPNGGSALYRIVGNDASTIFGSLTATGTLMLINPNGVLFGPNAQVDVGSLVASSLNISNDDFLNGNFKLTGQNAGTVVNQGVIKAGDEGYIVLLGRDVTNEGSLIANKGSVALGAGNEAYLDFFGNGLVRTRMTGDAVSATIKQAGNITANGGHVQLATSSRSSAINMDGIIQATNLVERDGKIVLEGGANSKVAVTGTLKANGASDGGTVSITGEQVALLSGAKVDVSGGKNGGDIYIGGGYQGQDSALQNARTTYVGQNVELNANAGETGNGGKVIVWSDNSTKFFGDIQAKGGTLLGDGGFAEVSGKNYLNFAGKVNLSANNGTAGTLLLDPTNINLVAGSTSNTTGFNPGSDLTEAFTDDAGLDSTFNVAAGGSFSGVAAGSTIVLQATNNINVNSLFDVNTATGQTNVNLEMYAGNDINVNSGTGIRASTSGYMTLMADTSAGNVRDGNGNINLTSSLTTGQGNVTLYGANILSSNNSGIYTGTNLGVGVKAGNITASTSTNGQFNLGAGGITTSNSGLNSNHAGSITINAGSITAGSLNANGALSSNPITQIGGNGGTVSLTANSGGIALSGTINTSGSHSYGSTPGNAGSVTLTTKGGVNIGSIQMVGGNGLASDTVPSSTATGGNTAALNVANSTSGNVSVGPITVRPGSNGGSGSGAPTVGSVTITNSSGAISTGAITTAGSSNSNGGAVTLNGTGLVTTGTINTSAGNSVYTNTPRVGGSINITGNTVNVSTINTNGGAAGGGNTAGGAGGAVNLTATTSLVSGTTGIEFSNITTSGGNGSGTGIGGAGGSITFNGNALANGTSVTLTSSSGNSGANGVGGNIVFNGQLNSATGAYSDLFLNTNGTTQFTNNVGALRQLNTITTDARGVTEVNGVNSIRTLSSQTYNDAVTVKQVGPTFYANSGSLTFNSTLNSNSSACCVTVTLQSGGDIYFNSNIGTVSTLYSLSVVGNNLYVADGIAIRTQTGQSYNANVNFAGNANLTSQAGGNINFSKIVNSPGVLNITTTRGNMNAANADNDFNEIVFGSLGGLNLVDKNGIVLSATNSSGSFKVSAVNDIIIKGGITNLAAGQDTSLTSTNGDIIINADITSTRNSSVNLTGLDITRNAGNISTGGAGVNLTATDGDVNFLGSISTGGLLDGATGSSANGGAVIVNGNNVNLNTINTKSANSSSTIDGVTAGNGGNVNINSTGAVSITSINSSAANSASANSTAGKGGNVSIQSVSGLTIGTVTANNGAANGTNSMTQDAGNVTIRNTTSGDILTGTISTRTVSGNSLTYNKTTAGDISITNDNGNVVTSGLNSSGSLNSHAGDISVYAGGDFSATAISAISGNYLWGDGLNGGNVTVEAKNITAGNIFTYGAASLDTNFNGGIGGNIVLKSADNINGTNLMTGGGNISILSDVPAAGITPDGIGTVSFTDTIYSQGGDITIEAVNFTKSNWDISSSGNAGGAFGTGSFLIDGGDISITAKNIDFGSKNLSAAGVNSGNITVRADHIINGAVVSAKSNATVEKNGTLGKGGNIDIAATNAMSFSTLHSNGGDITLNSGTNLSITSVNTTGLSDVAGHGVNGGNISLTSGGLLNIGSAIIANGGDATNPNGNGGNAGTITISAPSVRATSMRAIGGNGTGAGNAGSGGPITIDGEYTIISNAVLDSSAGNGVNGVHGKTLINGNVNSNVAAGYQLAINSKGQNEITGSVGNINRLSSLTSVTGSNLTIGGSTINAATANLSGGLTLTAPTVAFNNSGLGDISIAGPVLANNSVVTINTGNKNFSASNFDNDLKDVNVINANWVVINDTNDITYSAQNANSSFISARNDINTNGTINSNSANGIINLYAGNSVNINHAVTAKNAVAISLNADVAYDTITLSNNVGDVNINANVSSAAGDLLFSGNNVNSSTGALTSTGGNVYFVNTGNTDIGDVSAGQNILFNNTGDVNAHTLNAGGTLTINASGDVNVTGNIVVGTGITIIGNSVTIKDATAENSGLVIEATNNIHTGNLASGAEVKLDTQGNVTTGNIQANDSVTVTAQGDIQAGNISGTVVEVSGDAVAVGNVDADNVDLQGDTISTGRVTASDNIVMLANGDIQINGYILTMNSDISLTGNNINGAGQNISAAGNLDIQSVGNTTLKNVGGGDSVHVKTGGNSFLDAVTSQSGSVKVESSGNVTTGDIVASNTGKVEISGNNVHLQSAKAGSISARSSGDFSMGGKLESYSNDNNSIEIISGGSFSNNSNANIVTNNGGHYQIYTDSRSGNNFGSKVLNGVDYVEYGKSYGDTLSSDKSGLVFAETPTAEVHLSGNIVKTYDGKNTVPNNSYQVSVTGQYAGDNLNPTGNVTYDSPSTGQKVINLNDMVINPVTAEGKAVYGYNFTVTSDLTGTINPAPIVSVPQLDKSTPDIYLSPYLSNGVSNLSMDGPVITTGGTGNGYRINPHGTNDSYINEPFEFALNNDYVSKKIRNKWASAN